MWCVSETSVGETSVGETSVGETSVGESEIIRKLNILYKTFFT